MTRAITWAALAAALLVVWSGSSHAGAPGKPRPARSKPRYATFTDDQLRAAVYSEVVDTVGFRRESRGKPAPYFVSSLSIRPINRRERDARELATDDPAQARAWAEATVEYSSDATPLRAGPPRVTDRFFEFESSSIRGVPMRVHRKSYFDPSMVNNFDHDSLVGVFNARPIDSTSVRGLAEYLWVLRQGDIWGHQSLASFTDDDGKIVTHVIYETRAAVGDFGMCDEIVLFRQEYRVAKATGRVISRTIRERSIKGKCH